MLMSWAGWVGACWPAAAPIWDCAPCWAMAQVPVEMAMARRTMVGRFTVVMIFRVTPATLSRQRLKGRARKRRNFFDTRSLQSFNGCDQVAWREWHGQ